MVNRIAAAGLQVRPYFYRYGEDALDLCDVLGSYVPGAKVKLDEVSKILGLTGKPEGVDGGRVEDNGISGADRGGRPLLRERCLEHLPCLAGLRIVPRFNHSRRA